MCSSNASLCVKVFTRLSHFPVQLNGPGEGFASNVGSDDCADESDFGEGAVAASIDDCADCLDDAVADEGQSWPLL